MMIYLRNLPTISKQPWDTFQNSFEGVSRVEKVCLQTLRGDWKTWDMRQRIHLQIIMGVMLYQRNRLGELIQDSCIVEKRLHSLKFNFNHIVVAIEEANTYIFYDYWWVKWLSLIPWTKCSKYSSAKTEDE